MYTVVIADDEEEIRRGIVRKINWEEIGFQIVGEADNGIKALELVEELEPDLLLTDIRMPFMSGLELARQIREVRPTVQIAFLSGFDDFSYAQQAIQYNIISYLLKPISASELEEEMKKIKKIIDQKFEQFASSEKIATNKAEFLLPLLLDDYSEGREDLRKESLVDNAISCGFLRNKDVSMLKYVVIVTSISEGDQIKTTPANVNAIDMILKKYIHYMSCYLNGRVVSVLAATPSGFGKYLHILVEEIVQSVERIMGMTCSIGVSRETDSLADCRECYLEAMNALSYSRKEVSNVHFISDEERVDNLNQEYIQTSMNNMEELLRGGTNEEIHEFLKKFCDEIGEGKISPEMADFLRVQMFAAIFRVVYSVLGADAVRELQCEYSIGKYDLVEKTLADFAEYEELCFKVKGKIVDQRKKSGEVLCDKALEIIKTRYMDQDLSIVSVSNEIAVSPNYLSALLKKTTGSTFVELLTKCRIEKAKEMLMCTSLKIREITELCGYREQHYFSYCFKKATGMSPNQCRRGNES